MIQYGVPKGRIILDKVSGRSLDRPGYWHLKSNLLRSGDTLVITALNRLGRNKADIKKEIQSFKDNGITLRILNLPTTLMELAEANSWVQDMVNNILIEVYASIAEEEVHETARVQAQGIARAKAQGKHLGRPRLEFPANWLEVYAGYMASKKEPDRKKRMPAPKAAEKLGISETSFWRLKKRYEEGLG